MGDHHKLICKTKETVSRQPIKTKVCLKREQIKDETNSKKEEQGRTTNAKWYVKQLKDFKFKPLPISK